MDIRQNLLQTWLTDECGLKTFLLQPIAGDASFRRYFRVLQDGDSWVAMDAPPDKENCIAYIAISHALRRLGLTSPQIIKENIQAGFLLISDLGDRQLLRELTAANAEQLYGYVLDALAILQRCDQVPGWNIPTFTAAFMVQELELFKQWFLIDYLGLKLSSPTERMLTTCFGFLADVADAQPKVFMHRDYHSANLMVLPNNGIGILDFQDAFRGPVTYDVVSLLRDCYIDWPESLVNKLVLRYKQQINLSMSDELFLRGFDIMGLQRHLKALLTFSRKLKRDHNSNYLKHIPRTLNYILTVSQRYPECADFYDFLSTVALICEE